MTPADKAKELLWKYLPVLDGWTDESKTALAKECAIIAVDYILEEIDWIGCPEDANWAEYWQSVKTEIQNL